MGITSMLTFNIHYGDGLRAIKMFISLQSSTAVESKKMRKIQGAQKAMKKI